jgi:hypothetical protein
VEGVEFSVFTHLKSGKYFIVSLISSDNLSASLEMEELK